MNRRTTTVLAIIALILVIVFAITEWQRSVATHKLLADLPGSDYAKVMDAMSQLKDRGHRIVPALLNELRNGRPEARWRAVILLGDVGTRAAWDPLMAALKDDTPEVRAAAATALGKLRVKSAAPQIRACVADDKENIAVRIAAAKALGLLKDKDSSQTLQKALAKRLVAFEALAGQAWANLDSAYKALQTARENLTKPIKDPVPQPGEPPLTQEQKDKARADKKKELQTAVENAEKALTEAQTKFKEANDKLVEAGGKALEPPPPPAPVPVAPTPAAPVGTQAGGAATAVAAKPPAPAAVAAPKPPPATDPEVELRQACAAALGMIGDPEALATLSDSLDPKKEPNAEVRVAAAYALQDMARACQQEQAASKLVDCVLKAQEDKIGDVRAAALLALGAVIVPTARQSAVEQMLNKALSDDFYWAREAAKKTMKAMNMPVPEV